MRATTQLHPQFKQAGFTLVELLIVVIILGILAAILIPQFSGSTTQAKDAALDSTLANMRSAIDLYAQQHNGAYPAFVGDGTALATTEAAFLSQLSQYSDTAGAVATTKAGAKVLGPYMKKAQMPPNPIDNISTVLVVNTGNLVMTATAAGGWQYDTVTGKFIANIAGYENR